MDRKCWLVDVNRRHHTILLEHGGKRGCIRHNDRLVEQWELAAEGDSDHFFTIDGTQLAIHIRYPLHNKQFAYELSIEGRLMDSDETISSSPPPAAVTLEKVMHITTGDHSCRLKFQCGIREEKVIILDGKTIKRIPWHQEPDSDDMICVGGSQLGIHVRRISDHAFVWDLTWDGCSLFTGEEFLFLQRQWNPSVERKVLPRVMSIQEAGACRGFLRKKAPLSS
jgi:hypothetical protein